MKQLILILGIFCGTMGFAQELPPIQLDRPDQTETPYTVPSGHFQFESGLFFEKANKEEQNLLLPTVLSKYGVNDRFELRLITEISSNNIQGNLGLNPVEIGFKTRLLEEKGTIPMTSFIGHVQIPKFSSPNRKGNHFAPSFRFVMQHTLNPKMSLSYNLGAEWDGENPEATFIYTLSNGISLTEKLGAYLELYGFLPENQKPDHRMDGGFTYLIQNNMMVDVSSGIGLSDLSPKYFASLGFSMRLPN